MWLWILAVGCLHFNGTSTALPWHFHGTSTALARQKTKNNGIVASIRIVQEIQCLPYAGFLAILAQNALTDTPKKQLKVAFVKDLAETQY